MTKKHNKSRAFRKLVLAIGTLLAILFLLVFGPKIVFNSIGTAPELPTGRHWEGQVMTAMFLIFMIGYAIGWWRILWGGITIILAAFLVSAPFIILQRNYGSLIFGLPQFAIGILYVLLYLLEKRESIRDE